MSRPWTEREDTFLVYWGSCLNAVFMNVSGFHFVAEHDLNRTPQEADERVAELRHSRPDWFAETAEAGRTDQSE